MMLILVVPMNPEFFPEFALLLAGIFAGAIALRFLFARQLGRAARLGAIGLALITLAFVLGKSGCVHSPYGKPRNGQVSGLSLPYSLNARHVTSEGIFYRLRLSPVFAVPTSRATGDPEVFAVYSGQLGYERPAFRAGVAISARTLLTEDIGSFADRSETQAEFHADFGSGRASPGLELKFPLGDLRNTVPIVAGVSLGFSY